MISIHSYSANAHTHAHIYTHRHTHTHRHRVWYPKNKLHIPVTRYILCQQSDRLEQRTQVMSTKSRSVASKLQSVYLIPGMNQTFIIIKLYFSVSAYKSLGQSFKFRSKWKISNEQLTLRIAVSLYRLKQT